MKKIIRKFVMAAMTMVILFSNVSVAEASELKSDNTSTYEQKEDAVARTGKTYTFGRTKTSYTVGTMGKTSSSQFIISMPSNKNKDLVQGTVYFVPRAGGSTISYSYSNYSMEEYSLNLSRLPDGMYMVKIDGAAVGTSGKAIVTVNY